MKNFKKTEFIILSILWIGSLTTYSITLVDNYILYTSDYLGLIGLTIVSIISFLKPEKAINWLIHNGIKIQKLLVGVGNEKVIKYYKLFDFFPLHIVLQRIEKEK